MVKEIPLTQGKIAIVDDEDYERLLQWKWHYHKEGYALNSAIGLMHRMIINVPEGMLPDHINGNGLDNRKENLRVVTPAQNTWNTKKASGTRSQHKGVSWHKRKGLWQAQIMKEGYAFHLGYFKDEIDAAQAYIETKKMLHGEYGRNFEA